MSESSNVPSFMEMWRENINRLPAACNEQQQHRACAVLCSNLWKLDLEINVICQPKAVASRTIMCYMTVVSEDTRRASFV